MVGETISHYRILCELGSGGMGVVYEAEDRRLGRKVALKFLPQQLGDDPQALERLLREGRAVGALNHPNICTLHDVGEYQGRSFIVMERLRGQTLKQRLTGGALPWQTIVEFSMQLADALDTAHTHGIVHRDIKPANLFVTERQGIKILDFGLAKQAVRRAAAVPMSAEVTAAEFLTSPGSAVGTVVYMSPEQARGEEVDTRSDLFSLGAVMYEMATGVLPFSGSSPAVIYDAILNRAPVPPTQLNPQVPPELQRIILKSLEKDRELRYQTAAELRADLKRMKRESAFGRQAEVVLRPSRLLRKWAYVAGSLVLAAMAILTFLLWPRNALVPPTNWEQITDFADSAGSPALSPDGRMVTFLRGPRTFTTSGQVYMMVLPKGPTLQLTHDEQEKMSPVFTLDGSAIAYTVPWDTWTVPVFGGTPRLWLANASGLKWAERNTLVFSEMLRTPHMRLTAADASRTQTRSVYTPEDPSGMAHRSYLSPHGKWVLVAAEMVNRPPWEWLPCRLVPFDGSSPGRFVGPPDAACTSAAWSDDGKWMYFSSNVGGAYHIWRQRFPDGKPEQVTSGPTEEEGIAVSSENKWLITAVGTRRVVIAVRDGRGERPLISEGRPALAVAENGSPFSPDGKKLYYLQLPKISNAVGSSMLAPFLAGELWQADLSTGGTEAMFPGVSVRSFSFSPDGKHMVLEVIEKGQARFWIASPDRRSPPRPLPLVGASKPRFTSDYIYYFRLEGSKIFAHRIRPDGSGDERVWPEDIWSGAISHDGRHLALRNRLGAETGHRRRLTIVDWQSGRVHPVCDDCNGSWSDDGAWFVISEVTGSGENIGMYLLPVRRQSGLPDLPPDGFSKLADAARVPGARVIREVGDIGFNRSTDTYAVLRESVHRNLYRIPLPK